jgi:DNA-binding MarR family transcriptional regulator
MFTGDFLTELIDRAGRQGPHGADSCEVLLQFLAAANAVRDHLRRSLAEHGGTELGFEVLTTLRTAGGGPLPPSVISERCGIFRGTLTEVLSRLEACGLVTRHRNPSDRRQLLAELTPRGKKQCARMIEHYLSAMLDLAGAVPPELRSMLDAALVEMTRRAALKPPLPSLSHES